jgi:hypothetical protein
MRAGVRVRRHRGSAPMPEAGSTMCPSPRPQIPPLRLPLPQREAHPPHEASGVTASAAYASATFAFAVASTAAAPSGAATASTASST